ncbi:uncharacterized protein K460DRAFT_330479 [Cucurbitaria berberidis CBS 394.84]|uniref:Aminoglycoside phosphotransferase domain-containing protein n=1 Tax=Cucurbitaria berberidis CBS 394.84 TaxID=1168544 RepID=A0A9P4LC40_9PLEO|nr:uncharacterized protein K460DRAFT_330479 [Cucurbitaria berberidis CBS 394.84]KAF1848977.1 hypothetical protein K460DRAFT_330479 [Cucurbitaria berberidis CBS 394.84]
MSYINGEPLDRIWDDCEDVHKEIICHQIWDFIYQLRTIPKPAEYANYFQCGADGSASNDVLLRPLPEDSGAPFTSDNDLRQRIYDRYYYYNGRRYEHELPQMLIRSENTVFTHADIAPRNILLGDGDHCPLIGIVDWELAGWYPKYWEYANIMKPSEDIDWQRWMERTAPKPCDIWDISGIKAARRVVF